MLYKNYQIKIWQSAWVDKRIDGVYYSLSAYSGYYKYRDIIQNYKYIALIAECNPYRSFDCVGGSTPLIAIDLAKFTIDLQESNRERFDIMERVRAFDRKCLKESFEKQLENT